MSAERIKVPKTLDEATTKLVDLDGLVTAREWERAAIVYAFTTEADGPGRPKVNSDLCSPQEFAALGINGLKSKTTVRTYRRAWQTAIDAKKAKPPRPGGQVTLPEMPWPPAPTKAKANRPDALAVLAGIDHRCAELLDLVDEVPAKHRKELLLSPLEKVAATVEAIRDYVDNGRLEIPAEPVLVSVPT